MIRKFLLGTASAVALSTGALSTGALAADLPVQVPAAIPAVAAPIYNWTGFYAGLNLGYVWGNGDARYTGSPGFLAPGGPVALGLAPTGFGLNTDGFLGGAQIGFNGQSGQFVFGVEADIQATDAGEGVVVTGPALLGVQLTSSAFTDLRYLGTVRGRIGFAFDRAMVYATGGLAFGDVEVGGAINSVGLGGAAWAGSTSSMRTGYTIGAGVEYGITQNFSMKLEYLYYDLGNVNVTLPALNAAAAATGFFATQRHEVDGHIVRVGANFRF